jgi:hypothetical protein
MPDDVTKEALAITIRELGKQNEILQQRLAAQLKRPKDDQTVTACLGFEPSSFSGRGLVQSQPQVAFLPERFCVSKECAPHFWVLDIRIGMKSQLIAPHPIPANLFAVENVHKLREILLEDEFDAAVPVTFDSVMPGMLVTIDVKRIDGSDVPFECVMVGEIIGIEKEKLPKGPLLLPAKTKPD